VILVDTSVLIDFFKGSDNQAASTFKNILVRGLPFAITPQIYQEVLQGAKTEREYSRLYDYLITQHFLFPSDPIETYAALHSCTWIAGEMGSP